MEPIFAVLLCFAFLASPSSADDAQNSTEETSTERRKVDVTVVYATLCPDSKGFIGEQLWPTYQSDLGSVMTIELIPWGKASFTPQGDSWSFQCQHGPRECLHNKQHACALNLYTDFNQTFSFIHCTMTDEERSAQDPYKACATKNDMDWSEISECVDGVKGNELLHGHGVTTQALKPPLVFVPWIIINGEFRGPTLELALDDLPKVICDAYGEPRLPSCPPV